MVAGWEETRVQEAEANGCLELIRLLRRHDAWSTKIDAALQRNILALEEPVLKEEAGRLGLWRGVGSMAVLAMEKEDLIQGVVKAFEKGHDPTTMIPQGKREPTPYPRERESLLIALPEREGERALTHSLI